MLRPHYGRAFKLKARHPCQGRECSLSALMSELINKLNIFQALKNGLMGLYGWTCDESGVRHSDKDIKDKDTHFTSV